MSRGQIYAGKAAILLTVQDSVDQGLRGVRSKLYKFSNSLGAIGGSLMTGGILGSIASGRMLKSFAEFSDELLNLQVKLGYFGKLNSQQTIDMQKLEETIRHLGRTTSFTAQEVAKSATELAQAGFSVDEILNSLQATLDLARGTGYGLADSAAMMANAIRTFNLDTNRANEVVSMFVRATRLGTIGIEDLREALKYVSGTAFNLEQTLPTVLGFMVQLSESGLKGSLAGTSLNVAMLNMIKNLEKLQGMVPGFQLKFDAKGAFDFTGSLKELFAATKQMDTIKRTQLFGDIFNIRGARAVSSSLEIDRIERFISSIADAGDEGRKAAVTMDSGLGGAIRRATSAIDDFAKTVGKLSGTTFKGLMEAVAPMMAVLDGLAINYTALTIAIAASPFALAAAGAGLLGMAVAARTTAHAISMLMDAWRPLANMAVRGTAGQLGALGIGRYGGLLGPAGRRAGSQLGRGTRRLSGMNAFRRSGLAAAGMSVGRVGYGIGQIGTGVAATYTRMARNADMRARASARSAAYTRAAATARSSMQNEAMILRMMRSRGTALPAQMAAQQLRVTAQQSRMVSAQARAQRMMQVRGRIPGLFGSLMGGARRMTGFATLSRGLLDLGRGFLAVTRGMARFMFSWTGIWTALEVIILFGDKIPVVAAAFSRLGDGFSRAFGEIGKIGPMLGSSISLFMNSLALLSEGNGENATLGFNGMVTAVQNMASVVYNQLAAAWNQVVFAIAPAYDFIKKIAVSLYEVVSLVIQMSSGLLAGRFDALGKVLSGAGGDGSWNTFFEHMVQGIGMLIKGLFDWLDALGDVFDSSLYSFQVGILRVMNSTGLMSKATYDAALAAANVVKTDQDLKSAQRKIDRKSMLEEFSAAIREVFASNTVVGAAAGVANANKAAQDAETASIIAAGIQNAIMDIQRTEPLPEMSKVVLAAQEQIKALKNQKEWITSVVHAVGGNAHETRNALQARAITETEWLKKQTEYLESIDEGIDELVKKDGATF